MNEEVLKTEQPHRADEENENALPWAKRSGWRKRPMYKGWELEEILATVEGDRAAVTRSHSGYRVVNTPDVGFVDIDFNTDYDPLPQQEESLAGLRRWVAGHTGQNWRMYKTAGGLRAMRTDACQPLDDDFDAICKEVGADDYYRELCHKQKMFRARLTPKPIRCGIVWPRWNHYDGGWSDFDRPRIPEIIQAYELLAKAYKTCELVEVIGAGEIHPDLKPVMELHDSACKVFDDVPLEELCHTETAGPRLIDVLNFHVAFRGSTVDGVFRPCQHTPDRIWAVLGWEVQCALKNLDRGGEACREVQAEDRRQRELAAKWAQRHE